MFDLKEDFTLLKNAERNFKNALNAAALEVATSLEYGKEQDPSTQSGSGASRQGEPTRVHVLSELILIDDTATDR